MGIEIVRQKEELFCANINGRWYVLRQSEAGGKNLIKWAEFESGEDCKKYVGYENPSAQAWIMESKWTNVTGKERKKFLNKIHVQQNKKDKARLKAH